VFIVFDKEITKIKDGTKTQLRRMRTKARAKVDSVHQMKTSLFGRPECLVKVTRIWKEILEDISEEDAKAEGGFTPEAFIEEMLRLYGTKGLEQGTEVWCYEFKFHDHKRVLGEMRKKWEESQEARAVVDL
jgi:hypothetical protein